MIFLLYASGQQVYASGQQRLVMLRMGILSHIDMVSKRDLR